MAKSFIELSKKVCDSKIVFFLEGGYDINVLAEIVTSIVATFNNHSYELEFTELHDKNNVGEDVINNAISVHKNYWDI
jgi:acetoin utilization deacetylase AcuC-like enzyme